MNSIEFQQLEAVLFAAATPLTIDTLADIFEVYAPEVEKAIKGYEERLVQERRGIRIRKSASGIELVSAQECSEFVTKIRHRDEKLSGAAMETLAVIAFKQPITKGEVEEFRGVNCEKVLKQLLARDMIVELGRKETIGRPVIYGTSDNFLRTVGANSIEELQQSMPLSAGLSIDIEGDEYGTRTFAKIYCPLWCGITTKSRRIDYFWQSTCEW